MGGACKRQEDIGLLVFDYLQLFGDCKGGAQRNYSVGDACTAARNLCGELGIPGILIAQLNRECEKQNRPPRISDIRDSGQVEQDSDLIVLIHRDPSIERAHYADLIVAKYRNGQPGTVQAVWYPDEQRFVDPEEYQRITGMEI